MKKAICSIFNESYFNQGNHAISSAKKHNPGHDIILLTDSSINEYADIILNPTDLGLSDNWLLIGRIAVIEYVLTVLGYDTAIFIDGDTYTYSSYESLQNVTENHSIVVIPHITKPLPDDHYMPQNRIISLSGNYNTGVWSASKKGLNFLQWWKKQTTLFPILRPDVGLVNEQGWLRFAADFDENTKIFRHPAYNVAYWNIIQRSLSIEDNTILIDNYPLSIMHFSGLNKEVLPENMSIFQNRYLLDKNSIEYKIFNDYYNLIWNSND